MRAFGFTVVSLGFLGFAGSGDFRAHLLALGLFALGFGDVGGERGGLFGGQVRVIFVIVFVLVEMLEVRFGGVSGVLVRFLVFLDPWGFGLWGFGLLFAGGFSRGTAKPRDGLTGKRLKARRCRRMSLVGLVAFAAFVTFVTLMTSVALAVPLGAFKTRGPLSRRLLIRTITKLEAGVRRRGFASNGFLPFGSFGGLLRHGRFGHRGGLAGRDIGSDFFRWRLCKDRARNFVPGERFARQDDRNVGFRRAGFLSGFVSAGRRIFRRRQFAAIAAIVAAATAAEAPTAPAVPEIAALSAALKSAAIVARGFLALGRLGAKRRPGVAGLRLF